MGECAVCGRVVDRLCECSGVWLGWCVTCVLWMLLGLCSDCEETWETEEDLAKEIARIANLSIALEYKMEDENRVLTKEEAYEQIGHSASLFKGILEYVKGEGDSGK